MCLILSIFNQGAYNFFRKNKNRKDKRGIGKDRRMTMTCDFEEASDGRMTIYVAF